MQAQFVSGVSHRAPRALETWSSSEISNKHASQEDTCLHASCIPVLLSGIAPRPSFVQHIVPHFHAVIMATTNEKSTGFELDVLMPWRFGCFLKVPA
eukprot:scaffold277418_cov15-Tisochrysis_lutea.AAC.1